MSSDNETEADFDGDARSNDVEEGKAAFVTVWCLIAPILKGWNATYHLIRIELILKSAVVKFTASEMWRHNG